MVQSWHQNTAQKVIISTPADTYHTTAAGFLDIRIKSTMHLQLLPPALSPLTSRDTTTLITRSEALTACPIASQKTNAFSYLHLRPLSQGPSADQTRAESLASKAEDESNNHIPTS